MHIKKYHILLHFKFLKSQVEVHFFVIKKFLKFVTLSPKGCKIKLTHFVNN